MSSRAFSSASPIWRRCLPPRQRHRIVRQWPVPGPGGRRLLLVHTGLDRLFSTAARTAHASRLVRVARVVAAAAIFAEVWRGTNAALDAIEILPTTEGALIAGAVPAFSLMPAPLYLEYLLARRAAFCMDALRGNPDADTAPRGAGISARRGDTSTVSITMRTPGQGPRSGGR
jgi:hypothetical protein